MKLESIPNEIFIECFQYLNAPDIFNAFDGLNYRFHILIRNIPLYLNFQQLKKTLFNDFCQVLLSNPQIKQNILYLKLSNIGTCGQIRSFLSLFPLNEFIHLKSLSLIDMNRENIEQVFQMLASLLDLYYFYASGWMSGIKEIASGISKSKIRVLTLLEYHPTSISGSSSVISLSINSSDASDLLSILKNISMLKYLKINHFDDHGIQYDFRVNYKSEFSKINAVHLKQLKVGAFRRRFESVEILLKCFPNLEIFSIFVGNMFESHRWQHLIESSLPLLRVFNFKFDCEGSYSCDEISDRVSPFQNDFWHKHHWHINYVFDHIITSIYTTPYPDDEYRLTSTMKKYNYTSINDLNEFDNVKKLSLCANAIKDDSSWYFRNVQSLSLAGTSNDDDKVGYEFKEEQIEYLKKMINLSNIRELDMKNKCLITPEILFEILKQMPNISSLKLKKQITSSFCNNRELCEFLNKKIKILDFSSHSYDRYFKIEDIDWFCQTFSNLVELQCDIDNVDDVLFMLSKCSKLSIITVRCIIKPVYRWFEENELKSDVYINYQRHYYETEDCYSVLL